MADESSRKQLYSRYFATQVAPPASGTAKAHKFAFKAYRSYFGPLLPADKTSRILDVGCGSGEFLRFLMEEGYTSVQGVEFSDDQVEQARKTGIAPIVQCDIREFLTKSSTQWECIVAIDVMEHFNTNEVLSLIASVIDRLTPGGRFIMRSPNAGSPFFGSIRYADLTHETAFTTVSIEQLFRNAGFEKFGVCDAGPRAYSFTSAVRTIAWRALNLVFRVYTMIEMGYSEKIFSRNLIAWAERTK